VFWNNGFAGTHERAGDWGEGLGWAAESRDWAKP